MCTFFGSAAFVLIPALLALVLFLAPLGKEGKLGRWAMRFLSIGLLVSSLCKLIRGSCTPDTLTGAIGIPWIESQGITLMFSLNGLALTLLALTAALFLFSTFTESPKAKGFWPLMMLLLSAVNGVFISTPNVFVLYVFFEMMLIPVFFLLGIWGGKKRITAATNFFLFTLAGSVPLLVTILVVLSSPQAQDSGLSLEELQNIIIDSGTYAPLFAASLIVPALVKLPAFPFHGWLKLTYQESPTALLVVLSGIVGKVGLFLLAYFVQLFSPLSWDDAPTFVGPTLATIGAISIVYGALVAWREKTLRGVLTFSSLSHLGYGVLALSTPVLKGLEGLLLLMIAHGVVIGPLFALVDEIGKKAGSIEISKLAGLASRMPRASRVLFVLLLAAVAIPLTGGFVAEFYILSSVVNNYPYHVVVALIGSVLSVVYSLRLFTSIMWGESEAKERSEEQSNIDISYRRAALSWCAFFVAIFVGLFPQTVTFRATSELQQLTRTKAEDVSVTKEDLKEEVAKEDIAVETK